jgi:hypothetical protein
MRTSRRIQNRRESRVGPFPVGNKYRRNEPGGKRERKSKRGATEGENKIWDDQGVEEHRRRLEKARFVEQEVEKMAVELKEVPN